MSDAKLDERVIAIRADKVVGRGTCSNIDECYDAADLVESLDRENITGAVAAVVWARETMSLWIEQAFLRTRDRIHAAGAYVPERVPEVAASMLARYSSPSVACEMAFLHSMDFGDGTEGRKFWTMVKNEIELKSRR